MAIPIGLSSNYKVLPDLFQMNDLKISKTQAVGLIAIALVGGALAGAAAASASVATIAAFPIVVGALIGAGAGIVVTALALKIADLVKGSFKTSKDQPKTPDSSELQGSNIDIAEVPIQPDQVPQEFDSLEELKKHFENNPDSEGVKISSTLYNYLIQNEPLKNNQNLKSFFPEQIGNKHYVVHQDVTEVELDILIEKLNNN